MGSLVIGMFIRLGSRDIRERDWVIGNKVNVWFLKRRLRL